MTTDVKITYINYANIDLDDYCVLVFTAPEESSNGVSAVAWQVIKNIGRAGSHRFDYPQKTSVQATWDGGRSGTPRRSVHDLSFALEETSGGFILQEDLPDATPNHFYVANRVEIQSGISAVALKAGKPVMIRSNLAKGQRAKFVLPPKLYWAVVPNELEVGDIVDLDNISYQEVSLEGLSELTATLTGDLREGYTFEFSVESGEPDIPDNSDPCLPDNSDMPNESDTPDECQHKPGWPKPSNQELGQETTPCPSQLLINDSHHQDLFPFVYMRPWPHIGPTDRAHRFIEYNSETTAVESLYSTLVSLRTVANAREQMQQAATDFINGPDFIQDLSNLQGLIQNFVQLACWLKQYPKITWTELKAYIQEFDDYSWEETVTYIRSEDYRTEKDRVWQTFFALMIILGYRPYWLEQVIQTLVIGNLIEKLVDDSTGSDSDESETDKTDQPTVQDYAQATIILPKAIFPLPVIGQSSDDQSDLSTLNGDLAVSLNESDWVKPYAIGDLNIVRQRLLRYELGEVAHIENVLKGECKKATKRMLNQVSASVAQTDKTVDVTQHRNQANLLNEIQKTLTQNKLTANFDNLNTSYGPPTTVKYDGAWSIGNQDDPAKADITKFAKDITTQTANRIARQMSEVRTFSHLDELEETVVHSFDNRDRNENLRGIYRWVNKVYSAHVINDGQQLMIEFMLKTPAADYIRQDLQLRGILLERPKSLAEHQIFSHQDISRDNYLRLAASYSVDKIEPPPVPSKLVSSTLGGHEATNRHDVAIPEDYQAVSATVTYILAGENNPKLVGLIGKQSFSVPTPSEPSENSSEDSEAQPDSSPTDENALVSPVNANQMQSGTLNFDMANEDSVVSVAVMSDPEELLLPLSPPASLSNYFVNIEITCNLVSESFQQWQIQIYDVLVAGYQEQASAYYKQANIQQTGLDAQNPLINRQTEKIELKKGCVKQLLTQHFNQVGTPESSSEDSAPLTLTVTKPRYLQFFETAFEWGEMTYHFYPTLEGQSSLDRLTSTAYSQNASPDQLFTNFLQAGLARVLLPVRPGYTEIVLYYLSSGMIWPSANTLTPVNEADISLVNELKDLAQKCHQKTSDSDCWEITIPTSMLMVQDSSDLPSFGCQKG